MEQVIFTISKDGQYYKIYTNNKEFKNDNRRCSKDTLYALMESISENINEKGILVYLK